MNVNNPLKTAAALSLSALVAGCSKQVVIPNDVYIAGRDGISMEWQYKDKKDALPPNYLMVTVREVEFIGADKTPFPIMKQKAAWTNYYPICNFTDKAGEVKIDKIKPKSFYTIDSSTVYLKTKGLDNEIIDFEPVSHLAIYVE